jgi:hypothetical protein
MTGSPYLLREELLLLFVVLVTIELDLEARRAEELFSGSGLLSSRLDSWRLESYWEES